jgi:hypothetical protein
MVLVGAAPGLGSLAGCQEPDSVISSDLNSVAAACMRATACRVKPFARVGGCMTDYLTLRVEFGESAVVGNIYSCVNQADECAEVEACFGAGAPCNSSFGAYCDGDTAVYCDLLDATTYRYDCGGVGYGCRVDPLTQYAATCVPTDQAIASAQPLSYSLQCDDTFCTRTGEPCSTNELDLCSGEEIVACIEGEIIRFNCRTLGLRTCEMEENGWGHCRPQIEVR